MGASWFGFLVDDLNSNWGFSEDSIKEILSLLEQEYIRHPEKETVSVNYENKRIEVGPCQYFIKPEHSQNTIKQKITKPQPNNASANTNEKPEPFYLPADDSNDLDSDMDEIDELKQKYDFDTLAKEFRALASDRDAFDLLVALLYKEYRFDEPNVRKILQAMLRAQQSKKN